MKSQKFEIAYYFDGKNHVHVAICPQIGLVIDHEDREALEYTMMGEISYRSKNIKVMHIPKLSKKNLEIFEDIKAKHYQKVLRDFTDFFTLSLKRRNDTIPV